MKKRILVIDEGRLMCYGLKKALRQELLEVDTAFTVTAAVTQFGSKSFDLCLFDVCPPDRRGFELLGVISRTWPGTKIILMTANDLAIYNDLDEIIRHAMANGACHILCKPFDLLQLQTVVFRTLGGQGDGNWYRENFLICDKQLAKRKAWCRQLHYSLQVIRDGGIRRLTFPAESVSISEDSVELITPRLLAPSEIVSFDESLDRRQGVVIWSNQLDDQRYLVGIKFG